MALFGRSRAFLTPDAEEWQIACWDWHLRQRGLVAAFLETPLVLPNQDFFPALGLSGHARAVAIFDAVKQHAGLFDWPVTLIAQEDMPAFLDGGAFIQHESSCAGTFRVSESGEALITYAPELVDDPTGLIATLSHELGHYLNETFDSDPPGEADLNESATDITSILLGYGIFAANHCLVHETFDAGFRIGKMGYLSEEERIFSLAIFLDLTGRSTEEAAPYLKKYLAKQLKSAMKYIQSESITSSLKERFDV